MRTRLLALLVSLPLLVTTGCQSGSASRPTPREAGAPAATTNSPTPTATGPTASGSEQATLPDGTRRLFPGHRVVAYYGAAGAPALGVLGSAGPDRVWRRLRRQADRYDGMGARVLPAYELISFVATGGSRTGTDALRVPDRTIARYAAAARRHHALLVLDIQPGRGSFRHDAGSLRRWLLRPDVGLALDPEWQLHGHQRPVRQIGHTDAATVNAVSSWLDGLTARHHLPQKLLLVHQFTTDMVRHKSRVRTRPHLAVTFNMDGFGRRADKLSRYRQLATYPRFPIGIKLFYESDRRMLSPHDAASLRPPPDVVDYE